MHLLENLTKSSSFMPCYTLFMCFFVRVLVPSQHSAMDRQSQTYLHQSQPDRHRGGALRPL